MLLNNAYKSILNYKIANGYKNNDSGMSMVNSTTHSKNRVYSTLDRLCGKRKYIAALQSQKAVAAYWLK